MLALGKQLYAMRTAILFFICIIIGQRVNCQSKFYYNVGLGKSFYKNASCYSASINLGITRKEHAFSCRFSLHQNISNHNKNEYFLTGFDALCLEHNYFIKLNSSNHIYSILSVGIATSMQYYKPTVYWVGSPKVMQSLSIGAGYRHSISKNFGVRIFYRANLFAASTYKYFSETTISGPQIACMHSFGLGFGK